MQEAEIIAAARKVLGNYGIALSGMDSDGLVHAIGTGNGKMVSVKLQGTSAQENPDQIAARAKAFADAISVQMAGL